MSQVPLEIILAELKKHDLRFDRIETQISDFRFEVKKELSVVKSDLRVIREQTAHLTERVARLEQKSPSA
jgi:uncharacterized protein YoxC